MVTRSAEPASRHRARYGLIAWLVAAAVSAGAGAAEPLTELLAVGDEPPACAGVLIPAEELSAVALGPARSWCAGALEDAGRRGHSIVRLARGDDPRPTDLELPGAVRALAFGPGGDALYLILHREARRRPGDTFLVRVELETLKARKELRLPPDAAAMSRSGTGAALLIAAGDEVRSILVPDLRSGPLYRVQGTNLAIDGVPGSSRVLLGQAGRVVLVDLEDRPLEEGMPLRETLGVEGTVTGIAVASHGGEALARLEDGSLLRLGLDPLREGTEPAVERPVLRAEPPRPEPEPVPAPSPPPQTGEPSPPVEASGPPEPEPSPPTEVPPVRSPRAASPPERSPLPGAPAPAVRGRLEGPAARQVVAVVLFGPDNLLREAVRAAPAADGSWAVDELEPGRYRVQLDGGGSHALQSDPPFRTVLVRSGETQEVPAFRVLRSL